MSNYSIVPNAALTATADAIRDKTEASFNLNYSGTYIPLGTNQRNIYFNAPLVVGNEYHIAAEFNRAGKSRDNTIEGSFVFSSFPITLPTDITATSVSWDTRDTIYIYSNYISGPNVTEEDITYLVSISIAEVGQSTSISFDHNTGFKSAVDSISSAYQLLDSVEVEINTSSTTKTTYHTFQLPKTYTDKKIAYIKIRRLEGRRPTYFYGSDNYFMNGTGIRTLYRDEADYVSKTAITNYGVTADSISSAGDVVITARYNSSYSGVINGTFKCDVYLLDWPNNVSPYG